MTYDELRKQIEEILDPTLGEPLGKVNGIKKLTVGPTGVVELEVRLKDRKKDEAKVKLDIVKLVKINLQFPGIKIDFFDSDFVPEGVIETQYLAIASGKGGVGKSTVTVNLAVALTRLGKKVGIIDADVYGPSVPHILGLAIKPLQSTEDEKMIPLSRNGVEAISTEYFMPPDKPVMWRGPMLGKLLTHFFNGVQWQENIDIILIDLPPGTGDVALDVKTYVPKSKVLVVTTPHTNASHVAAKAGYGAKQIGHEVIGVVENMSHYLNPCNQKREFIFGQGGGKEVADKLRVPLLAQIPIGQPLDGTFIFSEKEEQGKIYRSLAESIIQSMHL